MGPIAGRHWGPHVRPRRSALDLGELLLATLDMVPSAVSENTVPSPTSMRMWAPVLMSMPGMDIRTLEKGWASSSFSIRWASSSRWSGTDCRELARLGTISAAASVPRTTTVCSSGAVKMSSISLAAILGAFGRIRVMSRRRPALRSRVGELNWSSSLSTAGCCMRGPKTRSRCGWICVNRPRKRLDRRVASAARSSTSVLRRQDRELIALVTRARHAEGLLCNTGWPP